MKIYFDYLNLHFSFQVLDEIFSDQERSKKKRRARRFREKRKIFKSHVLLSKTQEMVICNIEFLSNSLIQIHKIGILV